MTSLIHSSSTPSHPPTLRLLSFSQRLNNDSMCAGFVFVDPRSRETRFGADRERGRRDLPVSSCDVRRRKLLTRVQQNRCLGVVFGLTLQPLTLRVSTPSPKYLAT